MSINGQGHSLTLVKGHSDFKVKCLNFGLYTQVSDSGPLGPLVLPFLQGDNFCDFLFASLNSRTFQEGSIHLSHTIIVAPIGSHEK